MPKLGYQYAKLVRERREYPEGPLHFSLTQCIQQRKRRMRKKEPNGGCVITSESRVPSLNHSTRRNRSSPLLVGVNLGVQTGGLFRLRAMFGGGVFKTIIILLSFSVSDPFLALVSFCALTWYLLTGTAFAAVELSLRPRCSIWSAALSPFRLASSVEGDSSLFREGDAADEDTVA